MVALAVMFCARSGRAEGRSVIIAVQGCWEAILSDVRPGRSECKEQGER